MNKVEFLERQRQLEKVQTWTTALNLAALVLGLPVVVSIISHFLSL